MRLRLLVAALLAAAAAPAGALAQGTAAASSPAPMTSPVPRPRPVEVRADLQRIVADPKVTVTMPEVRGALAQPSPPTPEVMGPLKAVSERRFPGVPVTPMMLPADADGEFLGNAGIPTYGLSGIFETDENNGIRRTGGRLSRRPPRPGRPPGRR